ncbi:PilN domain-containing protein [Alkalibacter rhizosphaerae]|uniref:PilN domain-containing protein n=1 Tax=Alkalibacter rhizosphaerae TaxID=2815577 RepID=A0A974XHA1_9FIRM|nr:PilN domain-containing protein [Alkalibacter rhizosphaerae]QSX08645.1 PilN domain-containing protein [Alkalibacter rhizosphaerae]
MRDINLLPKDLNLKKDVKKKRSMNILLVLLVLALLLVGYGALYSFNRQTERDLVDVENQIAALAEVQARKTLVEKKQQELAYREQRSSELDVNKINFYNLLTKVETTLPESVSFITQNTGSGTMTISGVAKSRDEVADFAAKLNQIDNVSNVWINSVRAADNDIYEFNMNLVYSNGGDQQ